MPWAVMTPPPPGRHRLRRPRAAPGAPDLSGGRRASPPGRSLTGKAMTITTKSCRPATGRRPGGGFGAVGACGVRLPVHPQERHRHHGHCPQGRGHGGGRGPGPVGLGKKDPPKLIKFETPEMEVFTGSKPCSPSSQTALLKGCVCSMPRAYHHRLRPAGGPPWTMFGPERRPGRAHDRHLRRRASSTTHGIDGQIPAPDGGRAVLSRCSTPEPTPGTPP